MKTKMKKTVTTWGMLIILLAAVGCSETETAIDPEPGGGDQVALGVAANLKVDAGARSVSKSVVSGEAITYTDYATAPGIGVVITNNAINGWYTPDDTGDKHHVWYMGDGAGANWISITERGNTYGETKEVPYYLTKDIGKVYAYYPFAADAVNGLTGISNETSLKIPVTIPATGEAIAATTNNAKKKWNGVDAWVAASANELVNLSSSTEKDYLYFAGTRGRNVNNGRADGEPLVAPGHGDNSSTTNPGYEINLDMKHAMAMVSYRVYDGGNLNDSDVNFTKFEIKNHVDGGNPFKTGDGKMALKDGAITETSTTTAMTRTVTDYILMRQIKGGDTEGEHAFIPTGTGTNDTNGKAVSKIVSTIVYPIESFRENQIDVVITLQKGGETAVDYTITLPANTWTAGQNYIYTFSASRTKLTVVDVSVTAWEDKEQPEIPL